MRIALISDVHANIDALEAVLESVDRAAPDCVLSLGDQVGMGPEPTKVLDLLIQRNIPCLLGNHEMRVLALREGGNAALAEDINYAFVRWNAEQLRGYDLHFAMDWRVETPAGRLFLTHAGANDPFARIEPVSPQAYRKVLGGLSQVEAELVAIGHSHYTYSFYIENRPIVIVGSAGFSHNLIPGTAEYTLLELDKTGTLVYPQVVPYDHNRLFQRFYRNRLSVYEPIMARVTWEAMHFNQNRVEPFVHLASQRAKAMGYARITESIWQETAAQFPWLTGGADCHRFWGQ